jgi:origin recognition complex subunit 1
MRCRIHWFIRPDQLAQHSAKRTHFEVRLLAELLSRPRVSFPSSSQREIYYCIDSDGVVSTSHIVGHCQVTANRPDGPEKSANAWMGSPSKKQARKGRQETNSIEVDNAYYCGYAIDSRRGIYYSFDWAQHLLHALSASVPSDSTLNADRDDAHVWNVTVEMFEPPKKRRMSRIAEEEESADGYNSDGDDDGDGEFMANLAAEDEVNDGDIGAEESDDAADPSNDDEDPVPQVPHTPSRKRKRAAPSSTPRKRTKAGIQPTPRSKRTLDVRARKTRGAAALPPPPEIVAANVWLPRDPWLRAMHILHVAARPEALPCRDEEYGRVMRAVEELLEEGSGGCICSSDHSCSTSHLFTYKPDISGVPGTGKTATVHAVVRELKRMAMNNVRCSDRLLVSLTRRHQ